MISNLAVLNSTDLAKKDNNLYQFLKSLHSDLQIISNNFVSISQGGGVSISIDPKGAIHGNGSNANPIGVNVDNRTILIDGSDNLTVPPMFIMIGGESGEDGIPGPPGIRGIDGTAGSTGAIGPIGLEGNEGPQGDDGLIGFFGTPGATGSTGLQGPEGIGPVMYMDGGPGEDGPMSFIPTPPTIQTFELIESISPSGTGTVTFSNLGSYTHLQIIYSGRGDAVATSVALNMQFNGDGGSNYDRQNLSGAASTASASELLASTAGQISNIVSASGPSNQPGIGTIFIPFYRGAFNKGAVGIDTLSRATTTGNTFTQEFGINWRSNAAIASIALILASGSFISPSIFSLYGIRG